MRPDLVGHYLHGRLHRRSHFRSARHGGRLCRNRRNRREILRRQPIEVATASPVVGTVDLRVDYLQQESENGPATGRITRLGGRIASVQMTLENETGLLIATGCGSYVIS